MHTTYGCITSGKSLQVFDIVLFMRQFFLRKGALEWFQKFPLLETLFIFVNSGHMRFFETRFLKQADEFISGLNPKAKAKVLFNIDLSEQLQDPRLFKKLSHDLWEFRIKFSRSQIRLLAFWDKTDKKSTLVIATHGFIKKVDQVPNREIQRAIKLREEYFSNGKE